MFDHSKLRNSWKFAEKHWKVSWSRIWFRKNIHLFWNWLKKYLQYIPHHEKPFLQIIYYTNSIKSFIWLTEANGGYDNYVFFFAAGMSFPEGGLGHLLLTDYFLFQKPIHATNTLRKNEDADIQGYTATQMHVSWNLIELRPVQPVGVIVCEWV